MNKNVVNICFFNSRVAWGGGEKWNYDMAVRMHEDGFNTFVIAGKNSEFSKRLTKTPVPFGTVRVSNLTFLNLFKIYKVRSMLGRNTVDVIILNLSEDIKLAGIAARLAGVRHIIYSRGIASPIKNSLSNRLLFKHIVTEILTNSQETKRTILQNNPSLFPKHKIKVNYLGISTDRSCEDRSCEPNPFHFHREHEDEILLGNAGRLVAQKGQKYLIETAKKLKAHRIPFKLLIAGEGKGLGELKRLADEHGVSDSVVFLGFVEHIDGFMDAIDIFLLPSLWEGFGYVIVEAMSAGKPVIAFNRSSNPEVIENGETGYLIDDMSIDAFAEKIEFLATNKDIRETMGSEGKKRAEKYFDINVSYRNFKDYILSLDD
ncbi:MAG: glycosyltransferase family 4 protein [Desulfobacterales bacterium]